MEKQGLRVSARYSKILAIFSAWVAFGAAAGLTTSKHTFLGGFLIVVGLVAVVLAVDGRRMPERVHTKLDLVLQAIILGLPIAFMILLILVLGGSLLRPFLGYIITYLAGLVVLAALAARELRRGVRVD